MMTTLCKMSCPDALKCLNSNLFFCLSCFSSLLNADRISRLIDMVTDQSNITFDTVRFK